MPPHTSVPRVSVVDVPQNLLALLRDSSPDLAREVERALEQLEAPPTETSSTTSAITSATTSLTTSRTTSTTALAAPITAAPTKNYPDTIDGVLKERNGRIVFKPTHIDLPAWELDKLEVRGLPRNHPVSATRIALHKINNDPDIAALAEKLAADAQGFTYRKFASGEMGSVPLYQYTYKPIRARPRFVGVVRTIEGQRFVHDFFHQTRHVMLPLPNAPATTAATTNLESTDSASSTTGFSLEDGDIVLIEAKDLRAHVVKKLAAANTALSKLYHVAAQEQLDPIHTPQAIDEAEQICQNPHFDDPTLVDLLHLPFFAIDNEGSRDIDQIMYLEELSAHDLANPANPAKYVLWYGLADAAYYVSPGSALYEESVERGASYYLPAFSIAMLPKTLSEGVISLIEGEIRRALVVRIVLDAKGIPIATQAMRARVKNHQQLTYKRVSAHLEDTTQTQKINFVDARIAPQIDLFATIGKLRLQISQERGVVPHDVPEAYFYIPNPDSPTFGVGQEVSVIAEKYNAEISILANVEAARLLAYPKIPHLTNEDIPALYRAHNSPAPEKLYLLRQQIRGIAANCLSVHNTNIQNPNTQNTDIQNTDTPAAISQWDWRSDERLADYIQRLNRQVQTDEEKQILSVLAQLAVFVNERSLYVRTPAPHHGLEVDIYGRFTAPMRELVGIESHRKLFQILALERVCQHVPSLQNPEYADTVRLLWRAAQLGDIPEKERTPLEREIYTKWHTFVQSVLMLAQLGPTPEIAEAGILQKIALFTKQCEQWQHEHGSDMRQQQIHDLLDRAVEQGNWSKEQQKTLEREVKLLVMDQLFLPEINDPNIPAPIHEGLVTAVTPSKIYVRLLSNNMEIKVYVKDLKAHGDETFYLDQNGIELKKEGGTDADDITMGRRIYIQAVKKDAERWVFCIAEAPAPV